MKPNPPIILLSGMGADARLFEEQIKEIPQLVVPKWIDPVKNESLASYAVRFAKEIDPKEPCFIGGASFGGFVAMEMIQHLDVIACFLIGSVRCANELPKRITAFRKVSGVAGFLPYEVVILLCKMALLARGSVSDFHLIQLMKQMAESDASFLRWASRAVLEWEGNPGIGQTPVYQIHGQKDVILPVRNTTPDLIVAGAGHALSMSHPDEVTKFLKQKIKEQESTKA